jgi:hypothetical protein
MFAGRRTVLLTRPQRRLDKYLVKRPKKATLPREKDSPAAALGQNTTERKALWPASFLGSSVLILFS